MSLARRPLNLWLRLTEKRMLARIADPRAVRPKFERGARLFFHGPRLPRVWQDIAGLPTLHLQPKGPGPRILYFHGGAFLFGSPSTHAAMLSCLVQTTGLPAILPKYRLAPEHPFPAAIDDALAVYRDLAQQGPLILGGDSAGGNLALGLLGEILRQGLPKPLGCFAFSPITDASFTAPSFTENAKSDVILPVQRMDLFSDLVLAGQNPKDPRISPLYAEFHGAPPVALYVGDTEILRDDSLRMAENLRAQGVQTHLTVAHDLPHVWPLFHNILPEARATLRDLSRWITSLTRTSDS